MAAFTDYFGRAKSIGQPLPSTQGVSPERAAVLERIKKLQQEEPTHRRVTLIDNGRRKVELVWTGTHFYFAEEIKLLRVIRVSHFYGTRNRAMQDFHWKRVRWGEMVNVAPQQAA